MPENLSKGFATPEKVMGPPDPNFKKKRAIGFNPENKSAEEIQESVKKLNEAVDAFKITPYETHLDRARKSAESASQSESKKELKRLEKEDEFPILPRPEPAKPDVPKSDHTLDTEEKGDRLHLGEWPEGSPDLMPKGEFSAPRVTPDVIPSPRPTETREPVTRPVPETRPESRPLATERSRVDAKALRREMLQKSLDKVNEELPIQQAKDLKVPGWYRLWDGRTKEMRDLLKEKERLEEELSPNVGFGDKFKETARKAFNSAKKKFQEADDPYRKGPVLGLSEAPERTRRSSADIARVEREGEIDRQGVNKWGGLKERLKGAGTIGFWELRQAHRFEEGTHETAMDAKHLSHLIQKERGTGGEGLSLEDALKEKEEMMSKVKAGPDGEKKISRDAMEQLSQEITAQKVRENDARIEDIIFVVLDQLEERLKKYKGVSGQDVLTKENKERVADELRANLRNLRTGYGKDNEANLKRIRDILRMNLEEDWWLRLVYGPLEAILVSQGIVWFAGHAFQAEVAKVIAAKGGAITAKEAGPIALKKHLTYMATERMKAAGLTHFTEGQLHQVVMAGVKQNAVKVLGWKGTAGSLLDTAMPAGMPIQVSGMDKVIAGLLAAL